MHRPCAPASTLIQPEGSFSPHLLNTRPRTPPRMRTSGQRLGRGRAREPKSLRRLKSRPFAQTHGEFRPPALLLEPGRSWPLSGRSCAGVGLAHAHLCWRRARARAPQQRRRRFLSRGLKAAVGFQASGDAEGRGGGSDPALGAGGSALLPEAASELALLAGRRRRHLLQVTA